ncbi:TetR/AcrR family transcriptional regulator [Nocardia amikacinitolerans]|uniref:TetR/AcrR family transcriptional regulator n=1 Tax=Nocardia amikacinitolerans TaxID=756689 RepID=UPI0020A4B833|nr:TetR/AcrR family transcriptional regulator [Nocardia amikacinitolerans]MCP2280412.1 transcriptional regulator, TetR family [Nocardia amikacinitolerans]MCP2297652.1 transcriptional regulator, TetR family [Nocardia amikacinitolerans]
MAPSTAGARPATRRRVATRKRLLTAAYEVFAEDGFGRATVERVCERAGFTRGAFYSNFTSLDELFLAMWEERSAAMLADVRIALDDISVEGIADLRDAVDRLLRAVPLDEAWYRITAEFTSHALRTPTLRRVMAAREEAIVAALMPTVVTALGRVGRAVPDPEALGQAMVAVHDGTAVQVLMEPRSRTALRRRTELFCHVVLAYSTPIEG